MGAALAQGGIAGYPTARVHLRAGPGVDYPQLATLAASDGPLVIHGCTQGRAWCDVTSRGRRGWVAGRLLACRVGGDVQAIRPCGVPESVPIVRFDIERYWSEHYRDRPFYPQRHGKHGRPASEQPQGPPHRPWHGSGTPPGAQTARPGTPAVERHPSSTGGRPETH
ncbi:SH3 domain-containing protein [Dyella sp.]|uniref:SH3 domain-containing protein n=1 Tax=Dyella sp. TaxID=1869338 RepID=UPI0039C85E7F